MESRGDIQISSALVSAKGKILGLGRNRLRNNEIDKAFFQKMFSALGLKQGGPLKLSGYNTHAEQAAIIDAFHKNPELQIKDIKGMSLFNLLVNKKSDVLIRNHAIFVCPTCQTWLRHLDLSVSVFSPRMDGKSFLLKRQKSQPNSINRITSGKKALQSNRNFLVQHLFHNC